MDANMTQPKTVKFIGDFNKLKSLEFKFELYSSYNFKQWTKFDVRIWKAGSHITIDSLYNWEDAFLKAFMKYKSKNESLFPVTSKILFAKNDDYDNQKVYFENVKNDEYPELFFSYYKELNKKFPIQKNATDDEKNEQKKLGESEGIFAPEKRTIASIPANTVNVICELIDLNYIETN